MLQNSKLYKFLSKKFTSNDLLKNNSLIFSDIKKSDIIKFIIYTTFFSCLLFSFQRVISPQEQQIMNSAYEYWNLKKNMNSTNSSTIYDSGNNYNLWKKTILKPKFTIEFNPDNQKVDDYLLKSLKLNIDSKYFNSKVTPLYLTIDAIKSEPRWQVIGKKLIISTKIGDLWESIKVFVHELGHIVDLHFLPDLWDYDPSENFYNISWLSYNVKKKDTKLVDFVTWYALTNKYEDFAESFAFFVFHNEEFKKRTKSNYVVAQKYDFFRKYVFINEEFKNTGFTINEIKPYNWDSTKIDINYKKYLYYIK